MGFFRAPQFGSPANPKNKSFDSVTTVFRKPLSSIDIAALKVTIEANFGGVAFNYTGKEFDYQVTLQGPVSAYQKAMRYLFPAGRDDITIQPFQTLP